MSYLLVVIILFFVPLFLGLPLVRETEEGLFSLIKSWLYGTVVSFAVFEVVYLPCYFSHTSFGMLLILYASVMLSLLLAAVYFCKKKLAGMLRGIKKEKWTTPLVCALGLSLLLTVIPAFYTNADDDDAFYVAMANTTLETDTLFVYNPYTGREFKSIPSRYVLSPFPVYLAGIAKMSGMHAAHLAHRVLPLFFIPLSLGVFAMFGELLYKKEKRKQHLFYLFAVLLTLFSGYSVKNASVFLLYRIWQGKAILAAFLLPFIWVWYLRYAQELKDAQEMKEEHKKGNAAFYAFATLLSFAGAMVSSMGIFLVPVLMGFLSLIGGCMHRSVKRIFYALLCTWPSILLGLLYVVVLS